MSLPPDRVMDTLDLQPMAKDPSVSHWLHKFHLGTAVCLALVLGTVAIYDMISSTSLAPSTFNLAMIVICAVMLVYAVAVIFMWESIWYQNMHLHITRKVILGQDVEDANPHQLVRDSTELVANVTELSHKLMEDIDAALQKLGNETRHFQVMIDAE